MSRISEIADQLCELQRVIDAADERTLAKDAAKGRAQQLYEDATCMRLGLERALAMEVADNPADLLTQMLVFASTFMDSYRPAPGEDFDVVQRLLVSRMLEGLITVAGPTSTPVMEEYFHPGWIWKARLQGLREPISIEEQDHAA